MKKVFLFFAAMCITLSATVAQVHVCDGSHTHEHEHENALYLDIQQAKEMNVYFENAVLPKVSPDVETLQKFTNPDEVSFLGNISLDLKNNHVKAMNLLLSLNDENMILELVEVPEDFYDYVVITSDGQTFSANRDIKHYRGIIKDDMHSAVAITFYEDEIMGIICTDEGNFNIAKEKHLNKHLFYNDKNLKEKSDFACGNTDDFSQSYDPEILLGERGVNVLDKKVRFYVETEYDIYQNKGGVPQVEAYISGLFNEVAILYLNEDIVTEISELYIWTTNDPYTGTNTDILLTQFKNHTSAINGDLGILLTFRSEVGGGQAAGFSGLCNPSVKESLAVAMINTYYSPVPVYTWSVMVVTHELGHLFGSRHTHACVWNGNNTAIDGCAGYVEGYCSLPGSPPGGGTIMSYCHWTVGINFTLGFGPQPGNLIRNNVTSANCLLPAVEELIVFESYEINDSEGNDNGRLNPGETVHLTVSMKNLSPNPINNVQVTFTTDDALVTIVNGTANFGNFAGEEIKTIEDAFTITLSEDAVNGYEIEALITAAFNGTTTEETIFIPVYDYTLEIMDIRLPEETTLTPDTTSDVLIYLQNTGVEDALDLTAELSTDISFLTINQSTAYYGNLAPDQYKYRIYNVTLAADVPAGTTEAPVILTVTDETGRITILEGILYFENNGTPPSSCNPVEDLTAEIIDEDIKLSWTAPSEGTPEKYLVYCNDLFLGETTSLAYGFLNFESQLYHFCVEALYADGCTSELVCTDIIPCDAIEIELTLGTDCKSSLCFSLSWLPELENVTYKIYRDGELLAEVEGNEYVDNDIQIYVNYCYTVTAVCIGGEESAPSNEECNGYIGINELQNDIKIYPNPTNGELRIESGELRVENFEIFNITGQLMMQGKLHGETTVINVKSLVNGMYYLRIGDKTVKFVKE